MTPEQLKASILQYAIQGKLVEQRPEEGTAEELYQQMHVEIKYLEKKKLFKTKDSSAITEDEKPFDIPDGWKWVRLGEILNIESGKGLTAKQMRHGDIPVFGGNGITGYHDEALIEKETVVIGRVGFYCGSVHITPKKAWVTDNAFITLYPENSINREYLVYILRYMNLGKNSNATAQPVVSGKKIYPMLFPLPPLAEQKRIVAKIEELLPYIDRYVASYERLEQVNTEFPEDMKKSVLQYAIQGKLVEQRPEEGTAEELYRQIQAEKKRLIKEGKIKKEKPLPEIAEDEIPFDIPESWKWVRLSDLCKSISDGDHQPPPQVPNGIPFLVISNVSSGTIDFANTRYVPQDYFEALSAERIAERGDILFTVTGSYGTSIKVNCDKAFCFQRHIALLKLLIDWDYLFFALKSPAIKLQCDAIATGTAQKTVGLKSLRSIILPLPPLAEQKRIVAKLEEILPLCERLK
mgnify:CR=1 FL=1